MFAYSAPSCPEFSSLPSLPTSVNHHCRLITDTIFWMPFLDPTLLPLPMWQPTLNPTTSAPFLPLQSQPYKGKEEGSWHIQASLGSSMAPALITYVVGLWVKSVLSGFVQNEAIVCRNTDHIIPLLRVLQWLTLSIGQNQFLTSANVALARPCPRLHPHLAHYGLGPTLDSSVFSFSFFFNPHPKICLLIWQRETEWEREKNINVREKHWSAASHMGPDRGSNPQPRYVPWLGIRLETFVFGMMLQPIEPTGLSLLLKAFT